MSIGRIMTLAIAALVAIPTHVSAGPPGSTSHPATSVVLRDGLGDMVLSDGSPLYADKDIASTRITNYTDPAQVDRFQFQAWRRRRVRIQDETIGGGLPVTCEKFNWIVFRSTTTPNWYEVLSAGLQTSVLSDAFFVCHTASGGTETRWVVSYPDGVSECAVIDRLSATSWRFSVPGSCLATVTTSTKEHGQTTTTVQQGVSAPMEVTAVIP